MGTSNEELLRFYRDEVKFQSDLVANRVDAFISSQSFLVLGYATAMAESIGRWHNALTLALPPALALLGLVLTFHAWLGIRAAYAVIAEWRKRESELLDRDAALRAYTPATTVDAADSVHPGGARRIFREGAIFARRAPWIFALAWCYFGALPVLLYLRG